MEEISGEVIKEELWRNIAGSELSDYPANVADKIMAALSDAGYAVVKVPVVGHKGPNDTDASAFRGAADRLDGGYEPGGSNIKRAISRLLRSTADAIEAPRPTVAPRA